MCAFVCECASVYVMYVCARVYVLCALCVCAVCALCMCCVCMCVYVMCAHVCMCVNVYVHVCVHVCACVCAYQISIYQCTRYARWYQHLDFS